MDEPIQLTDQEKIKMLAERLLDYAEQDVECAKYHKGIGIYGERAVRLQKEWLRRYGTEA